MALSWDSAVPVWNRDKSATFSKCCAVIAHYELHAQVSKTATQHLGFRTLKQVVDVKQDAQASLLCQGLSPSIFRPESQSRPPSLQDEPFTFFQSNMPAQASDRLDGSGRRSPGIHAFVVAPAVSAMSVSSV